MGQRKLFWSSPWTRKLDRKFHQKEEDMGYTEELLFRFGQSGRAIKIPVLELYVTSSILRHTRGLN